MPPVKRKKKIRLRQKKTPSPIKSPPTAEHSSFDYLYPALDDPNFNIKIAERKEFHETQYEGGVYPIEEHANKLCNADFELAPHQMFVRNFLSFQTPYNSLLLYHGLGSGKTCSAIGISEDMRDYLKQMDMNQRIIVVASPNVQDNFKLQLFDDRKLKLIDGLWNIRACTGNKYLKEINPMNMKGLSRDKVLRRVRAIINSSYLFLGYIEFANYIQKKSLVESEVGEDKKRKMMNTRLQRHFANRLIIIDEIHNIRVSDENKNKRVASALEKLVDAVPYMRLLFLSATPMFNSYKEIIWLINIMNKNDRRNTMTLKEVFNADGTFRLSPAGEEIGKELLERRVTGYVSFVRGENPYTFPYRIWPNEFAREHTYASLPYPEVQLHMKPIIQNIERISVYLNKIGTYQQKGYHHIIQELLINTQKAPSDKGGPTFERMDALGYTLLQKPLEALNIIYPSKELDAAFDAKSLDESPVTQPELALVDVKSIVGKSGLDRIIKYSISGTPATRRNVEYKSDSYGRIFSPSEIGKYSGKIAEICTRILNSTGIALVYSQYIDGGLVPIALALEEMGFRRAGKRNSLFKHPPMDEIDAMSNKHREPGNKFSPSKYAIISGDKSLSPNNMDEIKLLTSDNNLNGENVRVVLISQAGSEGLDLKFIRQVHILDPWYNMNRIEQIIGRAVRTCSHKALPFIKRNVELYLHGTILEIEREEAADMYVYRLAEQKAIRIGEVSRVLKQSAIDCLLNIKQVEFTPEILKQTVKQELASGTTIAYQVGDKPYSSICDYMESCQYTCKPNKNIAKEDVILDTYSEEFIMMNTEKIVRRIRMLFKERFFYTKTDLVKQINVIHIYPLVQINAALNQLIHDNYEYLTDKYGRVGNLINVGDLYLYQPLEITNPSISSYHRATPVAYKPSNIQFKIIEPDEREDRREDEREDRPLISVKGASKDKLDKKHAASIRKSKTHIWEHMLLNFEKGITEQQVLRGEKDWYIFSSTVISLMSEAGVEKEILYTFIVAHILESLLYNETLEVLTELDNNMEQQTPLLLLFKRLAKEYYKKNILNARNIQGLFLYDNNKKRPTLLVKHKGEGSMWQVGEKEDEEDLKAELGKVITAVIPIQEKLGEFVGYMSLIRNQYYAFKVKDVLQPRHKGARCDQSGKKIANAVLQKILAKSNVVLDTSKLHQIQICILQEFYLRLFNKNVTQTKKWFLTPTEVLFAIR